MTHSVEQLTIHCDAPYPVLIGEGILSNPLVLDLLPPNHAIAIILDKNVADTVAAPLFSLLNQHQKAYRTYVLEATELEKSRKTKAYLEDALLTDGFNRHSCLIAIGGGITTDLVGYLASTFCRGVPVIYFPTTILSMVDASIGGKTGVNTPHGKNLIGTFNQPLAVVMDPLVLTTLSQEEYINGLAEVIKHALLDSQASVDWLLTHQQAILNRDPSIVSEMILKSCELKKRTVEADPFEKNQRVMLNLGHTIAHALETGSDHVIKHGEAVALGLLCESYLAHASGILNKTDFETIVNLMTAFNFPLKISANFNKARFDQALKHDKKNALSDVRFCFLSAIGHPYIIDQRYTHAVEPLLLDAAIAWLFGLA